MHVSKCVCANKILSKTFCLNTTVHSKPSNCLCAESTCSSRSPQSTLLTKLLSHFSKSQQIFLFQMHSYQYALYIVIRTVVIRTFTDNDIRIRITITHLRRGKFVKKFPKWIRISMLECFIHHYSCSSLIAWQVSICCGWNHKQISFFCKLDRCFDFFFRLSSPILIDVGFITITHTYGQDENNKAESIRRITIVLHLLNNQPVQKCNDFWCRFCGFVSSFLACFAQFDDVFSPTNLYIRFLSTLIRFW